MNIINIQDVAQVATVADENSATNATNKELSFIKVKGRITKIRTANACVTEAKSLPQMEPLFGNLWQSGQITFLVGDTGIGKSILSVQIGNSVAKGESICDVFPTISGEKVGLYYDLELSDRQFEKRFPNANFSDKFYRIVVNPNCIGCNLNFEAIKTDIEETGAKFIILDNITALKLQSTVDAEVAINIMKQLKQLQIEMNISILILAHTPKLQVGQPLSVNDLAGSKHLSNFADSIIVIGRSKQGNDLRYLKQVKSRDAEELEGVAILKLVSVNNSLGFKFIGIDSEKDHLLQSNSAITKRDQYIDTVLKLQKEGKTLQEIGDIIGVDKSTISRWLSQ
jgi:predicted ATP-dependent serine protease